MSMVVHEYPCPKEKIEVLSSRVNRLGQPLAGSFGFQKREPAVTGECQAMSVTRFVDVPSMVSHGCGVAAVKWWMIEILNSQLTGWY